ncbi:MAG: hypothetical protein CBC05_08640 [Crocinitomicaceae bacterium TMED45]|nr:MAG: hypothetical protein CBC05_08640 [Crocinitomicaceae bacterium TMED45]|tara:strand:- start:19859 stop:20215 length:357 start_codon:yes stop_codon:yes gene_type:complete
MKTLHNTKNCNYRRFLHKKLKHGKISGKFYKFLCRSFPYRLTAREVKICVKLVLDGKMTENKAITTLQGAETELRYQKELYKSNVECRKKISKTTTPYTKPLKQININTKDPLYAYNK